MGPLLSQDWYRVASMRPRLRAGVSVSQQLIRGERWYLLTDPLSGRHHRFNDLAYRLIASCDGVRTLDEVWSARAAADGDLAPTQDETVRVISQAFGANLFVGNVAPDASAIVRAQQRGESKRRRAAVNPMAFKVPLWDPDAFVSAHINKLRWLFTTTAARLLTVLIGLGALLLIVNASDYITFAQTSLGDGRMLLLMWLAYPVIKALHEMAHAFAVKAFGGEVHEMGITLLMLTPVPYVDASGSMGFADKHHRLTVAAAGIVMELVLTSAALCLWLVLEPGLLKDMAFAVVLIGGLSTLAVNGNPLLRFDGYHMLCDQFELPNLGQRSQKFWRYLAKRFVLRVETARFDGHARGALPWLAAYAPLSWLYRSALLIVISVWLAEHSRLLGLIGLSYALWLCLLQPGVAIFRYLASSQELHGARLRAGLISLVGAAALGTLIFSVDLPNRTHAPGVVWLQDEALVRLGTDGFVEQFLATDGDDVQAGQPLIQLSNDELLTELQRVRSQLARLEVERAASFDGDALRAGMAGDERERLLAEQQRLQSRAEQLVVRASVAGRLVIEPRFQVVGQYLAQGDLVAHVLAPGAPLVRALVRNEDIEQVREGARSISVVLAHSPDLEASGQQVAAVPRASTTLPSSALGEAAGGSIALDGSDKTGRTAREPRFQVDVRLDEGLDAHIGARAMVTFRHTDASAAELIAQFARRSFLRHFEK